MIDLDEVFRRLAAIPFRRKFRLQGRELAYLTMWGLDRVMQQGETFIDDRLAPAHPRNDGRQTPWRGHPIFVAQHATATCCRGCLRKVHEISEGHDLSPDERAHVLGALRRWLDNAAHADTD